MALCLFLSNSAWDHGSFLRCFGFTKVTKALALNTISRETVGLKRTDTHTCGAAECCSVKSNHPFVCRSTWPLTWGCSAVVSAPAWRQQTAAWLPDELGFSSSLLFCFVWSQLQLHCLPPWQLLCLCVLLYWLFFQSEFWEKMIRPTILWRIPKPIVIINMLMIIVYHYKFPFV